MEATIRTKKTVTPKILKIFMKVRDEFSADLFDDKGVVIHEQEDGYVPGFMPEGGGDYLVLDIDIDTGTIINWKVPSGEQVAEWVNGATDD